MFNWFRNWLYKEKNLLIVKLLSEKEELEKKLSAKRLKEDISDFIKKQKPVILSNQRRNLICNYCGDKYKDFETEYYVAPLCPKCKKDVQCGLITEEELNLEVDRYHA